MNATTARACASAASTDCSAQFGYRQQEIRRRVRKELETAGILITDGHFDYANGHHGRCHLNVCRLFERPSNVWRLGQDLIDLLPSEVAAETGLVVGLSVEGAILAHTIAALLDGRRPIGQPYCKFAAFTREGADALGLDPGCVAAMQGASVLLADASLASASRLARCAVLIQQAGARVVGCALLCDWPGVSHDSHVRVTALCECTARQRYAADCCPMCQTGVRP